MSQGCKIYHGFLFPQIKKISSIAYESTEITWWYEQRKWENQDEIVKTFQQSFKAFPFKAEPWPYRRAFYSNLVLEAAMEISILKHQTNPSSCWIQMKQDLSPLEKLLMSQLCDSVECYLLENSLGSPKVRCYQKLQGFLEEGISVYLPWLFLFLSQAKHC